MFYFEGSCDNRLQSSAVLMPSFFFSKTTSYQAVEKGGYELNEAQMTTTKPLISRMHGE